MIYTSLEQRTAQGYQDLFPRFIPDRQAPVSVSEQKEFYDRMEKLYQLAYDEPQLFVPTLHEDDTPPPLYCGVSDPKREIQKHMKNFRKSVDSLVMQMYLMGANKEFKLDRRQKAILSRMGIEEFTGLPPAWVWMAEKEHLERFQTPSRFAHCCFRDDYSYTADIYEKAFGNDAFHRLTSWMNGHGYKSFDIYDTTASNCTFSLTYANPEWSNESPTGGVEYKIKHTGISMRYEPYSGEPWILGVCIPGGMKVYLEHFDEMPAGVQAFVMSHIKRCDGCRYCVQTDKTGNRPLAKISVQYEGKAYSLCPYFPGCRFWWTSMDDTLADHIIGLLSFMDRFADNKSNVRN